MPRSATHGAVSAAGLAGFVVGLCALRLTDPFPEKPELSAFLMVGLTAGAIFLVDLAWVRVHLRPSTGLDFGHDSPSWPRTSLKLLGLAGSLGFCALIYWLFPEYNGAFYDPYFGMLGLVVPFCLALSIPYFYMVDRHMADPRDGYWHMGRLLALDWNGIDVHVIGQHLLGWLVKAFFLPLMFVYFCNDLVRFLAADLDSLTAPDRLFEFLFDLCYLVDVGLAAMGYLISLRIVDTHLRSAEPTMLGWVAALACYEPFASLVSRQYLQYGTELKWGHWFWTMPSVYLLWGAAILALSGVYAWATVSFGLRFSNLTHRGIITNGPYRWTKHPAYIAKNLSWWMISMPFMIETSAAEALRHSLLV